MSDSGKPKGLFITGTDTGVGKSLVAAALSRMLVNRGIKVGVMKPAETGVENCAELGPDAALLKWASNSTQADEQICPYRLSAPVAPSVAASRENIRIDYSQLCRQAQEIIEQHDFTIIEGAGGLMVPLAGGLLMVDLVQALDLPLLVVCRPGLGTINHTLLTLFAARNMDLKIAGYLLNNMPAEKTIAEETVAHTLATLAGDELLGILTTVEGDEQLKVEQLTEQISNLPTLSFLAGYLPETF
ncbi:MAG: dethiobiotin synthase [Desulfuromonadales bacterium]|nr:dethiobiotin synthase [Desulfuromonadales bacterium]